MSLEESLKRVAAREAPKLLEAVVEQARREAADVVRGHLVRLMVAEMTEAIERPAGRRPPEEPTLPATRAERGWYLFGITRAAAASKLEGLPGVAGGPVSAVADGPIAAIGNWLDVDPVQWGLRDDSEVDLATLGPLAQAHESVLEEALDLGAVLPFRFGTVMPSPDVSLEFMAAHRGQIAETLDRLDGKAEWGIAVHRGVSTAIGIGHDGDGARSYLSRRSDQLAEAENLRSLARLEVARLHESLLDVCCDSSVPPSRFADRSLLFKGSYLVANSDSDRFRQTAADVLASAPTDLGLTAELTGPWPAYSFCHLEFDAGATV